MGAGGSTQLIANNIANVEFFENNTLLGVVSNSLPLLSPIPEPVYALTWSNVPTGAFALKAIAVDTKGLIAIKAYRWPAGIVTKPGMAT